MIKIGLFYTMEGTYMIQILTYKGNETALEGNGIKVNKIHDAESLDSFEINIISLQDSEMWVSGKREIGTINSINDLKSLSLMVENSDKTNIVILLPQNLRYTYNRQKGSTTYYCELKNMIDKYKAILSVIFPLAEYVKIVYENTITRIGKYEVPAAFYFNESELLVLTRSEKSKKGTSILVDNLIVSTLNFSTSEEIIAFLRQIGLLREKTKAPEWMEDIKMFDDDNQMMVIKENNAIIESANNNISKAMEIIDKNKRYKSIFYTSGEELVDVVFEILEEMLGCDLSEFTDKKKEDFKFLLDGKVFIGEIKGVTPNVKKANVSQLDVHVQEYMDDNDELSENIVALLIMNHQRMKAISEREPVHEEVIRLAERNGSLIVDTVALLKLFENYVLGRKSREECIGVLTGNTGLLVVE